MIIVTLDTNLLITVIQERQGHQKIRDILAANRRGVISAGISNRLFQPDTVRMDHETKEKLHELLSSYDITEVIPSRFRWGISLLSGLDLISGGHTARTAEEILAFRRISDGDPITRPTRQPKSLDKEFNDIGDYDALYDHFCSKRDVFLTQEKGRTFSNDKRIAYKEELGLIIQDPEDFDIPTLD